MPAAEWVDRVKRIRIPAGTTIAEVFLKQARKTPDKVIAADQLRGEKTYSGHSHPYPIPVKK